ncbi:MAG: PAS domain-containing protein [Marinobacterium sp.]|nr:PAS domain-containing protein [Marinobacterium sp.]
MSQPITPRNNEVLLQEGDLIVSKTCLKGNITYANRHFMGIAGFSEQQLLNQPHNIIRHPDMPKGVYRMMWQELRAGHEFFGFVKNLCSDGSFYWVFANVTPDVDERGEIRGYYSVRRKPSREAIAAVIPLYQKMVEIEATGRGSSVIDQSVQFLQDWVASTGMDYSQVALHLYRYGKL